MKTSEHTFTECGLFSGIDPNQLPEIINSFTFKKYTSKSILIIQNQVPQALYIIHSGTAGIYNEDILLAEVHEPACIGESFIAKTTATATSIANTDLEVFEIEKDAFFRLIEKYPVIIQNLFALTFHRLRTSNDSALQEARKRTDELKRMVEERTQELTTALKELKHTQQFRDQFLANMSHEIRTPMNAIVGLINLLVQTPLNEQQEKYLQVIRKSGNNLLVIINDILDLSKIEAGKLELEEINFPILSTLESLQTILSVKAEQKGISLLVITDKNLPEYIMGDETRLTQILMNLTGNAIKFTEKGSVTIHARVVTSEVQSVDILFSVEDTGIGIPVDKQERIFESFSQAGADTARKYGGTGLGLNISKQLVELHKGKLQLESTPGIGSKFYFTIRYKRGEKPELAARVIEDVNHAMLGKKILVVEDNAFNQMVANDTILSIFPGVELDIAENGRTAIAMASATDYDIILMDIQLPDIDGFEITRFIRKELSEPRNTVPICALTASISNERISQCFAAGMNDFMYKPFSRNDLKEKIITNIFGKNKPEKI